jgi:hypothetical protein
MVLCSPSILRHRLTSLPYPPLDLLFPIPTGKSQGKFQFTLCWRLSFPDLFPEVPYESGALVLGPHFDGLSLCSFIFFTAIMRMETLYR